jgi:hypothetical protein
MIMSIVKLTASAAGALLLGLGGAANAAQYITQLDYDANGLHTPSYGTVTVTEINADTVDVKVAFGPLVDEIVDTGKGHVAFAFNLVDSPNSSVSIIDPASSSFVYSGDAGYMMSPFGTFSNAIDCCGKGASNGIVPPLEFQVTNTSGITFVGSGNHFTSNTSGSVGGFTGGWWFAVDTFDADRPKDANTYAVAGRDFCTVGVNCTPGIPEPASWALMILGFGGLGSVMRRRRATGVLTA